MRDTILTIIMAVADAGDPANLVTRQFEAPNPPVVSLQWLDTGYAARFCGRIDREGLARDLTNHVPALSWAYWATLDPVAELQKVVDRAHETYWKRK